MEKGVIKYYNTKKIYGFIKNSKTGNEIFFHAHECRYEDIKEGDQVTYIEWDSRNNPGKQIAVDVTKQ